MLNAADAMKEAKHLTRHQQIWVHERIVDGRSHIECIVCVTRTNKDVAGITKVYTNPDWRRRGCAERLVRLVCRQ